MAYIVPRTSIRARTSGALGAISPALARERRGGYSLRGLGATPTANGTAKNAVDYPPVRTGICPAWGCGPYNPPFVPGYQWPAPPTATPAPVTPPAYPTAPNTFYPGTPVPMGTPTTAPYVDASGNLWTFNSNSGGWMNSTQATGYYPGTPVPLTQPTNTSFTDSLGNLWAMINGQWINTTAAGAAIPANAAPSSVSVSVAPSSGYQSVLDWLTQQTLISGVPNWVIAAGGGLLALKFSRGR